MLISVKETYTYSNNLLTSFVISLLIIVNYTKYTRLLPTIYVYFILTTTTYAGSFMHLWKPCYYYSPFNLMYRILFLCFASKLNMYKYLVMNEFSLLAFNVVLHGWIIYYMHALWKQYFKLLLNLFLMQLLIDKLPISWTRWLSLPGN